MRFINSLSVALLLGLGVGVSASAQTLRTVGEPAEFPPASFTENQYVDSRGCVYIRAGISGNTTWVPRVARNRTAVCGFQPSLAQTTAPDAVEAPKTAEVAKPAVKPATPAPEPKVAQAAPAKPAVKPAAPAKVAAVKPVVPKAPAKAVAKKVVKTAPKPVVRKVAKAAPKEVVAVKTTNVAATPAATAPVVKKVAQQRAKRPFLGGLFARKPMNTVASIPATPKAPVAPQPVVRKPVRQAAAPAMISDGGGCSNASAFSRQYINSGKVSPVRCGPQKGLPYTPGPNNMANVAAQTLSAQQTQQPQPQKQAVVKRRLVGQQNTTQVARRVLANPPAPKGYRSTWDDGRLNPLRGERTTARAEARRVYWTKDSPPRLIDKATGEDVTHLFPGLKPTVVTKATRTATKSSDMRTRITTKSVKVPAPKVVKRTKKVVAQVAPQKPAKAAKGRYVQIGTFGNAANVQKNVHRLKASGMPVRVAKTTRNGRALQIVMAGPFQSPNRANSALKALRGAGYGDAFLR